MKEEYAIPEQLYVANNGTIDLDSVVAISHQGHITLSTYMAYDTVPEEKSDEVVAAWRAWKKFKLERGL